MARQHTTSQKIRLIVGAAFAGAWLVILFGELDGPATCLSHLLCPAAKGTLDLLPYVLQVAWQTLQVCVFNHHASPCPLQVLVSFWPLFRVVAGPV